MSHNSSNISLNQFEAEREEHQQPNKLNRKGHIINVLLFLIIALLPFGRLAELPIIVLMVWGGCLLVTRFKDLSSITFFKPLSYVFLSYFLIIGVSAVDSLWPEKSFIIALAAWRFYLLALVVIFYIDKTMLQQLSKYVSWLVIIWSLDALAQYVFGYNVLGMASYEGRLTGIFGQNVKLGPVLALLLPVMLLHAANYQVLVRWAMVALVVVVILLSGTRSAWLMMGFVLVMYGWHHVKGRRWLLVLKAMVVTAVAVVVLWSVSNDFQDRITRSMAMFQGTEQALDYALADRLPIWRTAVNMYVEHPINGVGARAFRKAYTQYAGPDDVWVQQSGGGLHAHHWVLELMAETGTFGLLLMLLLTGIIIKHVYENFQNNQVWPFAVALMAAMLPVVSLYSLFSSFWSICLWWMLAMLFAALKANEPDHE